MSAIAQLPGLEAEHRDRALSQFFTPPWLAERVWLWTGARASYRALHVLEPSAGNGALIRPITTLGIPVYRLVAYEIDPRHCAALVTLRGQGHTFEIRQRDFLADPDPGHFDISVLNPPYEDGQEIAFTEQALGCCSRVIGIYRAAMLFGQKRNAFWRWTDIRRMALLSERPQFGGDHSAKADFVVLDLQRRNKARLQGEASVSNVEWWLRSECSP